MAAHDRTEGASAAAELRRARRAVTGAAGALLLVHLLARPVRSSERFLTLCVPARRLASCQRTQRCRMSARGSRPKMARPTARPSRPAVPSSVVTSSFITRSPRQRGASASRASVGGCGSAAARGTCRASARRPAELRLTASRTWTQPPSTPGTAPSTRIRPRSTSMRTTRQVLGGDALDAEVTGHLLALEGLARILTAAGRTDANGARPTRRGWRAGRRSSSASCRRRSPCRSWCP